MVWSGLVCLAPQGGMEGKRVGKRDTRHGQARGTAGLRRWVIVWGLDSEPYIMLGKMGRWERSLIPSISGPVRAVLMGRKKSARVREREKYNYPIRSR